MSELRGIVARAGRKAATENNVKDWTSKLFKELDGFVEELPDDEIEEGARGVFARKAWAKRGVAELRKREAEIVDLGYEGLVGFVGLLAANQPEEAENLAKRIKGVRGRGARRAMVRDLQAAAVVERRDHDDDVANLLRMGKGAGHIVISLLPFLLRAGVAVVTGGAKL